MADKLRIAIRRTQTGTYRLSHNGFYIGSIYNPYRKSYALNLFCDKNNLQAPTKPLQRGFTGITLLIKYYG